MKLQTALIIDDSPIVRTILGALLRRQGLSVTAVRDGEAGYAHAVAHKPSIICLDLMLPHIVGTRGVSPAAPGTRDRADAGDHCVGPPLSAGPRGGL